MDKRIFLIAALFFIIPYLVSAAYTDGLEYYFTFDANMNPTPNFANPNNNLTSQGAPIFNSSCVIGGCFEYNGDGTTNYLTTPNSIGTNFTSNKARTFSFWIKFTNITTSLNFGGYGASVADQDWDMRVTTGDVNIAWYGSATPTLFASGLSWEYITFAYDGTNLYVYRNATFVMSTPKALNTANNPLFVGTSRTGGAMKQFIDELGLWSRNLTPAEISQGYNNGLGYNPYSSNKDVLINSYSVQPIAKFAQFSLLNATVATNNATSVNFTLKKPDGTYCVNNQNGTHINSNWISPFCLINISGQYNYTIISYNNSVNDTKSDSFTVTDIVTIKPINFTVVLEANQPILMEFNITTDTPIPLNFSVVDNSNTTCFQNSLSSSIISANTTTARINVTIQSKPNTNCEGNWTINFTISRNQYEFNFSIQGNITINTSFGIPLFISNLTYTWTASLNADSNETSLSNQTLNASNNATLKMDGWTILNNGTYNLSNPIYYASQDQISARLITYCNFTILKPNETGFCAAKLWTYGLGTNSWIGTLNLNATVSKYNTTKITINSVNYNIGTNGNTVIVIQNGGGGGGGGAEQSYSYCGSNQTIFDVSERLSGGKEISKAFADDSLVTFTLQFKSLFNESAIEIKDSCALRSGTDLCSKLIRKSNDLKLNLNELRSVDYELLVPKGTISPTELNLNFDVCGKVRPIKLTLGRNPVIYYTMDKGVLFLAEYISNEGNSEIAVGKYKIVKWLPMLAIPILLFIGLFALLKTLIKKKSAISWILSTAISLASFIGVMILWV